MNKYVIDDATRNLVMAVIDNAIHPNLCLKDIISIRQQIMTLPKAEDGNSTDSTDSKAAV